jgi:Domain of unknown function (DUF4157)
MRSSTNSELAAHALRARRAVAVAREGIETSSAALPHRDRIQSSFGEHDVSSVQAALGGSAASSAEELGAHAYTIDDHVGFAGWPDLHTAAHEAAHVVQQRRGARPTGLDGGAADPLERHADEVANGVVRGESVEALLEIDPAIRSADAAVQRDSDDAPAPKPTPEPGLIPPSWQYCTTHYVHILARIADRLREVGLPKLPPGLTWAGEAVQLFVEGIWNDVELFQDTALHRLMDLAYPVDLYKAVDDVRRGIVPTEDEPSDWTQQWHDPVGIAIANALIEPLDASIARMATRLVVQLDAQVSQHDAELVPSRPLDLIVGALLKSARVVWAARPKPTHSSTAQQPFLHGTHEVTFEFAGAFDPTIWNWIKVTSPKDPTPEDVASTPLIPEHPESSMGASQAYRIAASPPFFGIPIEIASQVSEMTHWASIDDLAAVGRRDFSRVADAGVLHRSALGSDEASLAQAPPTPRGTPTLESLLDRVDTQLAAIRTLLERVHHAGMIAGAIAFAARRRADFEFDPRKAQRWLPAVAAQESVLYVVASELSDVFDEIDRSKAKPDHLSVAVSDLVRAYALAAAASHLAQDAAPRMADAQRQKVLMPLARLDDQVRDARSSGADAETIAKLSTDIADLHLRVARGGTVATRELSAVQADAADVAMRARLTSIAQTVSQLKEAANDAGVSADRGPLGTWSVQMLVDMILDLINGPEHPHSQYEQASDLHGGWVEHLDNAKKYGAESGHDPNEYMQVAINYINRELGVLDTQLGGMKAFIAWCLDEIHDARVRGLIVSFALQIGLMLLTGEIAGVALEALRGFALAAEAVEDVRAVNLGWKATEVVLHSGLMTVASGATGGDISLQSFAENAIGMVFTEAAMKPFRALFEEDEALERAVLKDLDEVEKIRAVDAARRAGKAAVGFAMKTAKVTTKTALELGAGTLGSSLAHSLTTGGAPSVGDRDEWALQQVAFAVSAFVGARLQKMRARMHEQELAYREELMTAQADHLKLLADRAEALSARVRDNNPPSAEDAKRALAEKGAISKSEGEVYAARAPTSSVAKARDAELRPASAEVLDVPFRLAHLSPAVEGRAYVGTRDQIEAALEEARKLHVEVKATREADGRWTVEAGDRTITIREPRTRLRIADTDVGALSRKLGVNVVVDPSLGTGVEVHYTWKLRMFGVDLEPTSVRVGRGAVVDDVLAHRAVIERMTEFNGVLGRLRELRNVRLGRQYEKGTIGWEATNEILKIDELIDARRKQWRSDVVDENELEEEVEFLRERRAHFDEFLRSDKDLSDFGVGHIDAPGEVTREAVEGDPPYPLPGKEQGANPNNYYYRKSGKDSPKYELARKPNANVSETPPFRVVIVNGKPELQPADKPPEHERVKLDRAMHATDVAKFMRDNTSLGPFADMVESAEIATREQIDEEISKAYAARDHRGVVFADMVRNDVKDLYREHVVRVLADPSLSDAVSHRQLRLLLADVNPSDRGNLVEAWYKRRFAPDATEHVAAEPTRVGENNKEYVDDRKIDLVERVHEDVGDGEVIDYLQATELKDVQGPIDHDQFGAYVAMLQQRTRVMLSENQVGRIERLKYVFTQPEGARSNLAFIADAFENVEALRGRLTVEFFDSAGQRHTISNEQEARSWLSRLGGAP